MNPRKMASSPERRFVSRSPTKTFEFGERIGRAVRPGVVLALVGGLGAGKTVLAKGIFRGLGGDPDRVTSPTFILMARHDARLTLYHFDAYRLNGPRELLDIGAEEAFYSNGVSVVEWADIVMGALPPDRLEVHMRVSGPSDREIRLRPTGPRAETLVEALFRTCQP